MLSWNWCRTCLNCSKGRQNTLPPGRSRMLRFVFTALLCGLLTAQQTTPPPADPHQEQEPAPIRVTVDYVSTPAWVYDRDGSTISGLRPDQFRLFDNGKEQNIQVDVSFTPISLVICLQ